MRNDTVIDRYLAELGAELQVPARTRQRIVAEARDHLNAAVADDDACDVEAAQARAITAFGAAGVVARRFACELAVGATRRAARRGAAMLVACLALCDVSTSSFLHVAPGWINDGPGSALLWIIGQIGLVAGVVSLARAHAARREDVLDMARLRYVARGLLVLAGCSALTLTLAAAAVVDEITSGGIGLTAAVAIAALTLSIGVITAAGAIAACQASRRLGTVDNSPLSASGREPLIDLRDTLRDGLAWIAQRLPVSATLRRTAVIHRRSSAIGGSLRGVGRRLDPAEHPWRYGALVALLAGAAVPVVDLGVLVLQGAVRAGIGDLVTVAPLLGAIEAMLVLAGYATLGPFLGLRRAGTKRTIDPADTAEARMSAV